MKAWKAALWAGGVTVHYHYDALGFHDVDHDKCWHTGLAPEVVPKCSPGLSESPLWGEI